MVHRRRKQLHFGGPNVVYSAIVVICAACMNINKVLRVKCWGGHGPPGPPRFLRLCGVIHLELVTYLAVHFNLSHCSVILCTYIVQLCAE